MAARVLIVEDDPSIAELIAVHLMHEGHDVIRVDTAQRAVETTAATAFDLVVLDLGLPDFDGATVCRRVRREGRCQHAALLVVTARRLEADVVLALESGADAVMHKPFGPAELRWRVKALLRRWELPGTPEREGPVVRAADIEMDPVRREASIGGVRLALTRREFDLLLVFVRQPHRVFSRRALALRVWGTGSTVTDRAVDIAISRLRRALLARPGGDVIRTVRGSGYVLAP